MAGDHSPLYHANPLQESAQLQPTVDRDWQEGSAVQQSWYLNDGEKNSFQKQWKIILCCWLHNCSQLHVWRRHLTRVYSLWVPRLGLHNYRFSMTHCQVRCRFKDKFWEKWIHSFNQFCLNRISLLFYFFDSLAGNVGIGGQIPRCRINGWLLQK